ncbi:(p)ppGpp synthetase [Bacillus sp. FJAT-53711]|uniref:(P)ppGpp synthetase n=1 Tax=Bacillus yunxiaonensis TaxID=3127665 RepID=A0ABU8FRS3_9BACI
MSTENLILTEYKNQKDLHKEFCKEIQGLLRTILKQNQINCHSIDSRVKEESSLTAKVEKGGNKYNTLNDITDISGIRVITYFSDDVDKVAKIIQKEFEIDEVNSVDKRTILDPDRFGYLSLHYVIKLDTTRISLAEYQRFKDLKIEVQIRSILQHAWAEIEHDLGYKSKNSIPSVVKRDFSRLAGLLELADQEFIKIREELVKYNENVKKEIKNTPADVLIDKVTIQQLLDDKESVINTIDLEMCNITNTKISTYQDLDKEVKRLKYLNLNTIEEVQMALHQHKKQILKIATAWSQELNNMNTLRSGISLFYLAYAILGTSGSVKAVENYLNVFELDAEEERNSIATEVVKLCKHS